MYRLAFFILLLNVSLEITAQDTSFYEFAAKVGVNYNTIIDKDIIKGKQPIATFKSGVIFKYKPFSSNEKIFFINELLINQKGYAQSLDTNHSVKLTYLTFPFFVGYEFKGIDTSIGIQYSNLLLTNVKAGKKTYNNNELAVAGLINYRLSNSFSLFIESTYGLNSIIDYEKIDRFGNFNGKVRPFNNFQISFGTLIKIF